MLEGVGALVLANDDVAYVGRLNVFTLSKEVEIKEARAWPFSGGAQQIVDTVVSTETYTLKLGTSSIDKLDMSVMLNEIIQESASFTMPYAAQTTIPASTPYELAVSGLTANQNVQVSIISDTEPRYLTQVTTAPAAAGEFQVTSGEIVFHADDAGETVVYHYMKTYTSIDTLGVESTAQKYGACQFSGILKGTRLPDGTKIHLGRVKLKGSFEMAVGDETKIELEYSVETPAGWRTPVRLMFPPN